MRPKRHTHRDVKRHLKRPHQMRRRPHDASPAAEGKIYMYGRHALLEALRNAPHVVRKVFLSPEVRDTELRALLERNQVPTATLSPGRGKELVGRDAAHQGVIAVINPASLLTTLNEFLKTLELHKQPAVAVLGEVQDPHNVGAIIRSAAAFGLAGVLIPEHHQAPVTGAVIKTSAGMAFRIPLVTIGNVNQALATLKQKGFWIYGLAMGGATTLGAETFGGPAAFVVGNEGGGVREKTLEACDVTLQIPMHPRTESLNAAVSASVVFYEWSRKHPEAL
ncbi:MAG TPA: 23S rRNA (guanosine(2251)-2'-O)-methyltransferase RlmB [Candidatus Paceibacterota bacterium]|nr:23S rRNA (guanosine(2251)-2'-O)-methyltransferase RlmB [Candidatus Paceibacterota bacterium]